MKTLEEIFVKENTPDVIVGILSSQKKGVPKWGELEKDFDPTKHDIVTDRTRRPKVKVKNGQKEVPARLIYPAEMIAARRMNQMAFSIPVKRNFSKPANDVEKAFQKAIESVYEKVRIDGVNSKRMYAYFASCEVVTFWFTVDTDEEEQMRYGFKTSKKIRCRSFSPMPSKFSKIKQADVYPYFDDYDDLIVLSVRYKDADGVEHFDAYTAKKVYYYNRHNDNDWQVEEVDNPLGKIPAGYLWRPLPVYYGISGNREDTEFTLSRDSDILGKNQSPIMKVKGNVIGEMPVGDTARQVYQLENGGDLDLVSPALSTNDAKTHVGMLKEINQEITQLPDLSLENIKGIGAQSGEARKTLLTDPHMKVKDESHDIIEFLDREFEIVKAILCHENEEWKDYQHTTTCKHVITPFIQNDRSADINDYSKASGGPVMSRRTAVDQLGMVDDTDAEIEQMDAEQDAAAERERMTDIFPSAE